MNDIVYAKNFIINELKKEYPSVDEVALRAKLNKATEDDIMRLSDMLSKFEMKDVIPYFINR